MSKIFQFQEDTEASLYGDFKRIITCVKFVPCIMHCVLFFSLNEKTLLVFFILPSSFLIESTDNKVLILQFKLMDVASTQNNRRM